MARRISDEEEERDEPRPRRKRRSDSGGGSGTKIALILGGVGLAVFLFCGGGCVYWLVTISKLDPKEGLRVRQMQLEEQWRQRDREAKGDQNHAKVFLDYWVALLQLGDLDEAYRRTSTAYQARMSREQFEQFVQWHADLKPQNPGWSYGLDGKPGNRFTFLLSRPGPPPYGMVVVREGDEWRLDDIEVK
jgi:hypothetical protein